MYLTSGWVRIGDTEGQPLTSEKLADQTESNMAQRREAQ